MKELATKDVTERAAGHSKKITQNTLNENLPLNRMLVKTTKLVGALQRNQSYTMDIDATFISTQRRGAIRNYKPNGKVDYTKVGFNPMICLIGNLPVFISMRNGDANSKLNLNTCLRDCFALLDESEIRVGRVISDAAGYTKDVLEMLQRREIKFNVRFPHQAQWTTFNNLLRAKRDWRQTEIATANFIWDCEIGDITYTMHESLDPFRVVAIRIPTEEYAKRIQERSETRRREEVKSKLQDLKDRKRLKEECKSYEGGNWKEQEGYLYKFIITNDFDRESEQLIKEYNKRGDAERKFSFMKRDFGWRMPPFYWMNQNMVFLIAAAMANNVFRGMQKMFVRHVPGLMHNHRLNKFIDIFIINVCEYIGGDVYEFSNTDIDFEKIMA